MSQSGIIRQNGTTNLSPRPTIYDILEENEAMGVRRVKRYLFRLNRELLDLNAVEMDEALINFFQTWVKPPEALEFHNHKGLARTFNLNWEENLIQGKGIKGFFAPFSSSFLLIEQTSEQSVAVLPPHPLDATKLSKKNMSDEQKVLTAMNHFVQDHEKWFELYQIAEDFHNGASNEELIGLPFVRELEAFDYQQRTVKQILSRFKGRVILSDEVGLGKTVEAGMAMLEYIMRGLARKILIITPPSLVTQWENEMKRKFNQDFIRFDDPNFKKQGDKAWERFNKVIVSLSTAKRKNHQQEILKQYYDLVIVDEAHHLKNRNTQAFKFVNSINKKYMFLLTATPVQNHLEELYNLITLIKPGQLRTYSYFKKSFIEGSDGFSAKNVDRLKNLLSDCIIRNKRSNVDVTFTKRKAITKIVELSSEEQALYQEVSRFIRNKFQEENPSLSLFQLKRLQEQMGSTYQNLGRALMSLTDSNHLTETDRDELRHLSMKAEEVARKELVTHPKMEQLQSILTEFNDKMLIFTKYKTTQQFISTVLKARGFKVAEFHGGLKRKEKEEQITYFKESAQVLVSTEVGGEGRNLQFCHGMVNYDLPWNPMAIEQRIGRIHRIGQTRDVFVFNLAAKDTIEHYILNILDKKINMFELVVGEVDAILGDIEEKEDFSDMVMKAWAGSNRREDIESELNQIGDKLLANKERLLKQKALDKRLF